jgi:hypothetical protein
MKLCFFALLLFSFPAIHAQTPPDAHVYVYSYRHVNTLWKAAPPVYLDGKQIAKLDGTRFFIINIKPGPHSFHLKDKKRGGIDFDFKSGETYYIRLDMRPLSRCLRTAKTISLQPRRGP